ncbi:hypothetical protein CFP56_003312 [Quercus suber]|uniref:Uncharacterized protein n=1 Tax=Quercus suber TaxID=58331 RepID=A0AAW0IJP0_QUESU
MAGVISKAANGIGGIIGTAFAAPIKTLWIFMVSSVLTLIYRGVCPGPWDVVCFIEHLCVSNLVKLLMILVHCYIIGDLPMHRKKPLHYLFLVVEVKEHQESKPPVQAPFSRCYISRDNCPV